MSAQRAAQLVEAGLFLRLSGDLDGAKRLFEQALRLDPTNARAKQLLESGSAAAAAAAQPTRQGPPAVAPLAAPLGNAPGAAPRAFSPPAVAPAASSGFDADWGSVMDGGSGGGQNPWDSPKTTAPVAPMGAPVTTTMAFPLNEARALPVNPSTRAPMGAPPTSTMAYPMSSQPPAQPPVGAPPTSTMAYPMSSQPPAQPPVGAPPTSTMAYPMSSQPPLQAPRGAPPTSTLAYPMSAPDGGPGVNSGRTGWTPPPLARPQGPSPQPEPPDPGWGAPQTSTMAFPMSAQPAAAPADAWAPAPEAQSPWNEPQPPADPWKGQQVPADPWSAAPQQADPAWEERSAAPAPASPWDAPADSGWGAPPTSTLAFPMSPQKAPEPEPAAAPADPWLDFKVQGGAGQSPDADSAMWNSVSLAPAAPKPTSYAPPAVDDPYSQPSPPEDDWSHVAPQQAIPTAPQGVPSGPRAPPLAPSVAPVPPAPIEAVPWDSPVPVEPPPRPRPAPVAFADWAQPSGESGGAAPGPWSTGETPVQPIPAPPVAAAPPLTLQPLAPMLPGPPPLKPPAAPAPPTAAVDDTDDIEVVEDEGEVFGQVPPPPRVPAPVPAPAVRRHAMATGIPEAPQWEDPGIDAAVVDNNDTLDSDFSFNAPPPMTAGSAPAPAYPPAPAPSGPPPLPLGYEASLVSDAQSAWDSNSNPGLKLDAKAPKAGDAFDLIRQDDLARKAIAPEPDKKDKLASLIRKAKDLIGLDDHTGAMALINQADALAPNDGEVKKLKERSEATLQRMYESKIGNLERVPRVKLKETEIIWLNLDHRAGFMLAQVDGSSTFEDLFALSGMSRLDTARILAQLIDEGVIVV